MEKLQNPDALLDASAVARWLGIARATVYEQAARGVLPCLKLWKGKRRTLIRFERAAVEAFLKGRSA
jgi:excisionase family DNA binding protein